MPVRSVAAEPLPGRHWISFMQNTVTACLMLKGIFTAEIRFK